MRKLIVQEWLSADGFAADENGSTDFFGATEDNKQNDEDVLAEMEHIDTILLGANTYRLFVDFWPTYKASKEMVAPTINQTRKIVFSNSLEQVEWGPYNSIKLQPGDAPEVIGKLKNQEGKDLVLWGSLSLFRSLLSAKLIDEIQIRTVPILLGKGIKLFGESDQVKLKTIDTKRYDSGNTLVSYKVIADQ